MVLKLNRRAGFCFLQRLALSLYFFSCTPSNSDTVVSVYWEDSVPAAISVPRALFRTVLDDSLRKLLEVHLMNDNSEEPVIGHYIFTREAINFRPLIPLTRGLHYDVRFEGRSIGEIHIPWRSDAAPQVVQVYPSDDTVPENLLKIYIQFSKPMGAADETSFVALLDSKGDTIRNVFLDLRPGLWDRDGRLLTLWLDPGRIKRDLKPNEQFGPPLAKGQNYELVIKPSWRSREGVLLGKAYSKRFFVKARDQRSPQPLQWSVLPLLKGTREPLEIRFHEALDFALLKETIRINDPASNPVPGQVQVGDEEKAIYFMPSSVWEEGDYKISFESRLEDLAGNNLNRLFDRDITSLDAEGEKEFHELNFSIR